MNEETQSTPESTPEPLDTSWIDNILSKGSADDIKWADNVLHQWMDSLAYDEFDEFMDEVANEYISNKFMALFLTFACSKKNEKSLWDRISEEI